MALQLLLESQLPSPNEIYVWVPSHRVWTKHLKRFENWDIPTVALPRDSL